MSIFSLNLNTFKQDFTILGKNKEIYGEVHTPFSLIKDMFDFIPNKYFQNKNLKWLDPCTGKGYFSIFLYKKLFIGLQNIIKDEQLRHTHIITNMIYIIEINSEFIPLLKNIFGEKSNIYNINFLDFQSNIKFDFIIGNPPFNTDGLVKVPTKSGSKKKDGKTIWQSFIKKSMSLLKKQAYLLFITPSIWMKNDHPIFKYLLTYKLIKIKTLTNTETNKIFNKQAQTPTCYFLVKNISSKQNTVLLYDQIHKDFINYQIYSKLSLPLFIPSIIKKLVNYTLKYKSLKIIKTSMRPGYKGYHFSPQYNFKTPHPNIKTCKLNKLQPYLVINYSNIPCHYYKKPKLVLAHKMYGFPYLDYSGNYGISNRDNYVILNKSYQEFTRLKQFLSTRLIRTVFEATRYRMSYLEKYIFDIIPDITYINNFPFDITENNVQQFFNLNDKERLFINHFHKKKYLNF